MWHCETPKPINKCYMLHVLSINIYVMTMCSQALKINCAAQNLNFFRPCNDVPYELINCHYDYRTHGLQHVTIINIYNHN